MVRSIQHVDSVIRKQSGSVPKQQSDSILLPRHHVGRSVPGITSYIVISES